MLTKRADYPPVHPFRTIPASEVSVYHWNRSVRVKLRTWNALDLNKTIPHNSINFNLNVPVLTVSVAVEEWTVRNKARSFLSIFVIVVNLGFHVLILFSSSCEEIPKNSTGWMDKNQIKLVIYFIKFRFNMA
jgi:hypothetical protein